MSVDISIVVPMFNEEEVVGIFFNRVQPLLESTGKSFEYVCVDDGSRDNTFKILYGLANKNKNIKVVKFSRNFNKEAALTAGMSFASGRAVIVIDADLQNPPELILEFIKKWEEGYDVVVGKRLERTDESAIKKFFSSCFYSIFNKISKDKIPQSIGDFRLMDRKVVDEINKINEKCRFMKGLMTWVGFNTAYVEYSVQERVAGKTKWNYWKLWNFAIDGITASSSVPLRVWSYVGVIVSIVAFMFALIVIIKKILFGDPVQGYPTIMTAILFLGGIQLISLGVIGEYLSRMYVEVKNRPLFVVEKLVNFDDE